MQNHASPEELVRVIWEASLWASLQFGSHKTLLIIECLLITFTDIVFANPGVLTYALPLW